MTFRVTLFTRQDCSLCDTAKEDLKALQSEIPHELVIVDVDRQADLKAKYGARVPVLETGSYVLEPPFDRQKLRATLGAARDRAQRLAEDLTPQQAKRRARANVLSRGDRISWWISNRWLLSLNLVVFLYVGLPFLAPVLMNAGLPGLARPIYGVYSFTCHQLAFRSWFLFGEQPAYPRAAANVDGLATFGEVSGLNEDDLLAARGFIGNEQVGYKVGYCQRDVAIYAAMLAFGLIYAATKKRIPALPWWLWILIGMGPIGIDGFSQLLSQIPGWPFWVYRESTPFLRTLTGAIFGFTTAWFGFPVVGETMAETRLMLATKIARLTGSVSDPK
ncbi:MAG: DUF2085 domain-containing protein [Anaerolineae bacterium]|nr:MAG: DUF2085 domain-containing protein [Anaerolineae bacterium]